MGNKNHKSWFSSNEMTLFYEAISKINQTILYPDHPKELIQKSIQTYLNQKDPYSNYLSAKEYQAFKETLKHTMVV
jgi:C-terminal processing protease CtpA/Prc